MSAVSAVGRLKQKEDRFETTYASLSLKLEALRFHLSGVGERFFAQLILEGTLTEVRKLKFRLGKAGQTSLLDLLCGLSLGFW